jgi:hypothetical protein
MKTRMVATFFGVGLRASLEKLVNNPRHPSPARVIASFYPTQTGMVEASVSSRFMQFLRRVV